MLAFVKNYGFHLNIIEDVDETDEINYEKGLYEEGEKNEG